jgi:hypothetical protein
MNHQFKEKQDLKDDIKIQQTPHLSNLINQLNNNIKINDASLKNIKNPKKLLESLYKLYNIIGMIDIKESIAKQTSYLINKLQHGERSLKMLNTVLYGDQGVGKTSIGIILAEIWHHLGFLERAVSKKDSNKSILSKLSSYNSEVIQFYTALFVFVSLYLYDNIAKPLYHLYGNKFILITCCAFFTVLLYLYTSQQEMIESTENDMIVITSRSTFVNMYLGGTAHQTENFLNENRGKVIFIDEAYSLYNGYSDSYGSEALASINKYMSEHEDEIVIIFAGYEEMLKNTIFKVQPGLNRRCMWKFNCMTYDGKELYEIFKLQLKKENYVLSDDDLLRIEDLIIKYQNEFTNNAGSTEQLAFYAQLNHSTRLTQDKIIIYEDVKNGLKDLIKNTIPPEKKDMISELKKISGM